MKKLVTLLLVLTGFVCSAKADWYVAGTADIVNGEAWTPNTEANKMEDIGGGLYRLVVTGKSLSSSTVCEYKITDGTWDNAYGWSDNNAYFSVQIDGTYTITYIFDSTNFNVYEASALLTDGPDIYLHFNNNWSDNNDYKFNKAEGIYTLDLDISNYTETFYYRFHVKDWGNDCGTENDNYEISTGIYPEYNIILDNGNYYGEHNFKLPLDTKPCAKLSLTLKFINKKLVVAMQCHEKISTNANGYCTFVNNYPLTIDGATAYYATDNNNGSATAVAITNPAANTPMLIKGSASTTYYFPVAASGSEDPSATNAFKAGTSTTAVSGLASGSGPYNYILNGDKFYAANGKKVAEGKAYLQLSAKAPVGARVLVFEDEESTGIGATLNDNGEMTNDQPVYNLAGQRVGQPTKGLYIVNGKKVIIK